MTRRQHGNRRRKVWRKELKASWSRKAHHRVKLDATFPKSKEERGVYYPHAPIASGSVG